MSNGTLFHECYFGFGDNIYERPFVVELAQYYDRVFVKTPFPELYWDQDPRKFAFVRPHTRLFTQAQNIASFNDWVSEPFGEEVTKSCFRVVGAHCSIEAVIERHEKIIGLQGKRIDFKLPINPEWTQKAAPFIEKFKNQAKGKKICLVKRPTIRREWACYTRNPKPEYIQQIVDRLKDEYFIVSLANLREEDKEGRARLEWLDGEIKGPDIELHHGEIDIWTLAGLVPLVDLSICSPGFFIPLCLATKANCFCVFGGTIRPDILIGDDFKTPNFAWAAPDPFCHCGRMDHDCNKEIKGLIPALEAHLGNISHKVGQHA